MAGINSSYTDVESGTTIAAGDNHRFSEMLEQGFEDGLAVLLEYGDVLVRAAVVDVVGRGSGTSLERGEDERINANVRLTTFYKLGERT